MNPTTSTKPRVLVMEDEDDLRHLFSRSLRRAGYEVLEAPTLQSAQDLLKQHTFDAFLCDMHMGSDRSTHLLREQGAAIMEQGTHIIVMSAEARYRNECEQLGIDLYLEKPVIPDVLIALLNRLLSITPN